MNTQSTSVPVRPLTSFWERKLQLQRFIIFITSIAFTALVFVQVISRYIFNYSIFGIEESASYLAVTMYFIGAAYGTHAKSHISASVVDTLCRPGKLVDLAHLLTRLISVFLSGYLSLEIWYLLEFNLQMDTRSVELRLPMAWVYGGMLTGTALMTFYFIIETLEAGYALISRSKPL